VKLNAVGEGVMASNEDGGAEGPQGVVEGKIVDKLCDAIGQD
jgi:hypothetical protein